MRHLQRRGDDRSVVLAHAVFGNETFTLLVGEFRDLRRLFEHRIVDHRLEQVGFREITVVRRLFLAAHGAGLLLNLVEQPRLLDDLFVINPVFPRIDLALHLDLDRFLDEFETVDVLDLDAGVEFLVPFGTDGDVHVATERSLLHVRIGDVDVTDDGVQLFEVQNRLFGRTHVGLGDDLQQRRSRTVKVYFGVAALMDVFPRVRLDMGAVDADGLVRTVLEVDLQAAVLDDRRIELGDLVGAGAVRVEVAFTVKIGLAVDGGVDRRTEHYRFSQHLLV